MLPWSVKPDVSECEPTLSVTLRHSATKQFCVKHDYIQCFDVIVMNHCSIKVPASDSITAGMGGPGIMFV